MGWAGRLFEAGRLLTFPAFRMGAYSRWAPRDYEVPHSLLVGANSRWGAYSNKYGKTDKLSVLINKRENLKQWLHAMIY